MLTGHALAEVLLSEPLQGITPTAIVAGVVAGNDTGFTAIVPAGIRNASAIPEAAFRLALAVATGTPFGDRPARLSAALVLTSEGGAWGRRMQAWASMTGKPTPAVSVSAMAFNLDTTEDTDALIRVIGKIGARGKVLVLVDGLAAVAGVADASTNDGAGEIVAALARTQHETGCGCVIVNHVPRLPRTLLDTSRLVLGVYREANKRILLESVRHIDRGPINIKLP